MIKPLRTAHRRVWTLLALLLPAGILLAWLAIPNDVPVKLLKDEVTPLPVTVRTAETNNATVVLRSNEQRTAWQLEWRNKMVLQVPSAVIYYLRGNSRQQVGRIEAGKDHLFAFSPPLADPSSLNLIVYDFIHERIIDSLKL